MHQLNPHPSLAHRLHACLARAVMSRAMAYPFGIFNFDYLHADALYPEDAFVYRCTGVSCGKNATDNKVRSECRNHATPPWKKKLHDTTRGRGFYSLQSVFADCRCTQKRCRATKPGL